jgi:hypothetical protein
MAQCGFNAIWYNKYYGWGNKYAYVVLTSENVDYPLYVNVEGHTSSYGTTILEFGGGWRAYSGGRWQAFIVKRGDDTVNYPLQFKVTGSPCGDIVFTSPAAFDLCFFPYQLEYCPSGVTSPFYW